ncbi:hypothetical protein QAD02_018762 [Eretmocerus hayati]|uniref:Uncharacterized protein n=1 Tax=Eretmocerus hayati TaxID=131215 RepID=A0ACC2PHR2_9HYME|nr:hypothetical protein QAD02_018762 [Eretmocerus hayati]
MYQRESVRVLLENGANLNIKDEDGKGILCFAAELDNKNKKEEYIDIMRMLIAHGAEINCNQVEYFLPFVTVIRSGTMEALQLFFEHGITLENCGSSHLLRHAAENEDTDIMKYLLETFQYDVNEIHREGDREFTPLFVAVDTDQKHNAQLLIEYGADVDIPCVHYGVNNSDFTASSPLFAALNYGDSRMVDLLLSAGANLNVDTNDHLWQPIMVKVLQPVFYEMLSSLIGESTLLQSRETFDLKNRNVIVERFANFSLEIEKQCLAELEALKNITFYGSVTLYDMLGGKDVTRFVRSNHVAETFKSQKVVECFPIYGNRIEYCYILAKSKREVMDKAIRKLNEILQFCFCHYHEILYIILSHLRLQDLHILSIV